MKQKRYLFCFFMLWGALLLVNQVAYWPTYHKNLRHIHYDARSENPEYSRPFSWEPGQSAHCSAGAPKALTLDLTGILYARRNWQNLFQTADYNQGLRWETDAYGTTAFLNPDLETGMLLQDFQFSADEKYHLRARVRPNGQVTVWVNGLRWARGLINHPWEISHIKMGGGFDDTRYLDGSLSNASLSFTCYSYQPWAPYVLYFLAVAGLIYFYARFGFTATDAMNTGRRALALGCILLSFIVPDLALLPVLGKESVSLLHLFFVSFWTALLTLLVVACPRRVRAWGAVLLVLGVHVVLMAQTIYWKMFHIPAVASNLRFTQEALPFLAMTADYLPGWVWLSLILSLCFMVTGLLLLRWVGGKIKYGFWAFFTVITLSVLLSLARGTLGPRLSIESQVYKPVPFSFSYYDFSTNLPENLQGTGLYHFTFRDLLRTFQGHKQDAEIVHKINAYRAQYSDTVSSPNAYTGKLKGKNLILVLIESGDYLALTPQNTPTLFRLQQEGLDFTRHYSNSHAGAGPTFNAEFSINTGWMTPVLQVIKAQDLANKSYPTALPALFKRQGYRANSFHMNTGTFYNRANLHKAWGFDRYYSLRDAGYPYDYAKLDTHLLDTPSWADLLIPSDKEEKFFSFIITYTAHAPYDAKGLTCQELFSPAEKEAVKNKISDPYALCLKAKLRETDRFFALLLQELEKRDRLQDTVIVGFTDHYAYGFPDHARLQALRQEADIDLLNHTPFFIWSPSLPAQKITQLSATVDIYPILLNLFGLKQPQLFFMGKDVLGGDLHQTIVLSDRSFVDLQGIVSEESDEASVKREVAKAYEIYQINDLVLQSDYLANNLTRDAD